MTQSSDRQAGTTPLVLTQPAGRLEPDDPVQRGRHPARAGGVGAQREATTPAATATALPELDPPEIRSPPNTLSHAPYGERVPVRPVANWSRLVLPTRIAPASSSRRDAAARAGRACRRTPGRPAVVGSPATSMLSLTANGTPYSGGSCAVRRGQSPSSSAARACSVAASKRRDPHGVVAAGGDPGAARRPRPRAGAAGREPVVRAQPGAHPSGEPAGSRMPAFRRLSTVWCPRTVPSPLRLGHAIPGGAARRSGAPSSGAR